MKIEDLRMSLRSGNFDLKLSGKAQPIRNGASFQHGSWPLGGQIDPLFKPLNIHDQTSNGQH
jgi:hypothetical protein